MARTTRHAGQWTLEDQFASPWHYLPVEVPPGTWGVRVTLSYDRAAGVLDLGCLGPGGPRDFRGWSGGARDGYVITADEATPGYLPGEIEPGQWQVIVGPHQVPPGGLPYELTAEAIASPGRLLEPPPDVPPAPDRPPRRNLPASDGRRWRAGDLHTHTVHSDGALTVGELARFAAESGLDFIAVTDHNTVSHHRELPRARRRYGITLIPGQEVTRARGTPARWATSDGWTSANRPPMAEGHPGPRRPAVGQPSHRGPGELDARHARAAPAGGGVALELARPELDDAAVLVACVASGRRPGRRQRLAPDRIGRAAGNPDHLGGVRQRATRPTCSRASPPDGWRSRRTGTARCSCVRGANSWPWTPTALPSPARTARAPGSTATWRGSGRGRMPPPAERHRGHARPDTVTAGLPARPARLPGPPDRGRQVKVPRQNPRRGTFAVNAGRKLRNRRPASSRCGGHASQGRDGRWWPSQGAGHGGAGARKTGGRGVDVAAAIDRTGQAAGRP